MQLDRGQIRWGSVQGPSWKHETVVIVGGGTSLIDYDFNQLRGKCKLVAVNGSMFDIPWADLGFGLDILAFDAWYHKMETLPYPVYYGVDQERMPVGYIQPEKSNITFLKRHNILDRLSENPEGISSGGSSGFGAFNVVFLKEAKRIILLGFDYTGQRINGRHVIHHNEKHYAGRVRPDSAWYQWARNFSKLTSQLKEHGVQVWNASEISKITAFPKIPLSGVIDLLTMETV